MSADDTLNQFPQSRTDWKRLKNLTEEELEAAIESDPDTFAPTYEELANGRLVYPDGKTVLMVPVDEKDADWFFKQHIDTSQLIAKWVHDYVRDHR